MARRGLGLFYAVGGFALSRASKFVELIGDDAPEGSTDRLGYHLTALLLLAFALGLFIAGGVAAFRAITGRSAKSSKDIAGVFADEPRDPSAFDPDDALARYMRNKASETPPPGRPVLDRPRGGGFGRKPV